MPTDWKLRISKCCIIPQRYVLSLMGFWAVVNAYLMRVVLSVAITEMVVQQNVTVKHSSGEICPEPTSTLKSSFNTSIKDTSKHLYNWNEETQGIILSSFYWGYIITHIPGGILSEKFGGKHILGIGILSTAIFTLITPTVVEFGNWQGLTLLRVFIGFGEGITFPALNVLLSKWAPVSERSILGTIIYAGAQMGIVIGNSASGLIIGYTKSWEAAFYIFGCITIIWFILWLILCYSEPSLHPFISEEERLYLERELEREEKFDAVVPWKAIFTSIPLLAVIIAEFGHDWGLYMMITDLPKYLKILKFDIKTSGLWSSLPYLIMWVTSLFCAWSCDWIISNKYMKLTTARKTYGAISSIIPGFFLLFGSYAGCNQLITVIMFTVGVGFMGGYYCGIKMNILDLSSNYAGTIMAIVNGIGALSGIIAPYLVGVLTEDQTISQWRTVYWITFVVLIVSAAIFILCGSGDEQWWNNAHNKAETINQEPNAIKLEENNFNIKL